jgi:hypothetical protein
LLTSESNEPMKMQTILASGNEKTHSPQIPMSKYFAQEVQPGKSELLEAIGHQT